MYGARLPNAQGELQPIKKRTRLQVTDRNMAETMTSFCDGSHDHLNLIGSTLEGGQLTKAAAAYQEEFARALAHELSSAVQRAESTTSTTTLHLSRSARPKLSKRKELWKNAKRASALAASTLAVASSYLTEITLPRGGQLQPCIFELGSDIKTNELQDIQDFGGMNVTAAVQELKPKVLWIHAGQLNGYLPRLLSAVEAHSWPKGGELFYKPLVKMRLGRCNWRESWLRHQMRK